MALTGIANTSYKTSETLLGIETEFGGGTIDLNFSYKTSETLLGIETSKAFTSPQMPIMLQNLWNPFRDWNLLIVYTMLLYLGYKTSETLLGIET